MKRISIILAIALLALLAATASGPSGVQAAGTNTIATVASISQTDQTSIAVRSNNRPVVSFGCQFLNCSPSDADLHILSCGNSTCTSGNNIATPDTAGAVGAASSLKINSFGNPVVSYLDSTNAALKVLVCADPGCTAIFSTTSPDVSGTVGYFTSLQLDASNYPVVAYDTSSGLKILHCNDMSCAGGNDSIKTPDTGSSVGRYPSLTLDASGYPVVSYQDVLNANLKVLHCNDANCDSAVNGAESITTPDPSLDDRGYNTTLKLDAAGNPVVSYVAILSPTSQELRVMHCNDANCSATNGAETITVVDSSLNAATGGAMQLDASGRPVISYGDSNTLSVLHCGDVNCATGNTMVAADSAGGGAWSSLALDSGGNPALSYFDFDDTDIKVLRCGNSQCRNGNSIATPDTSGNVGAYSSIVLDGAGNPVVGYNDVTNGNLKILHCNDASCAMGGDSVTTPDASGLITYNLSIALDSVGRPVVSYYDGVNKDLKVLHCDDANCTGGGESITTPDTAGDVGLYASMALDSTGNPIVSYWDGTNADLKILHCDDANCAGDESTNISSPDTAGAVGNSTWLALDGSGNPVVSYTDITGYPAADLKVLHCDDPNCTGIEISTSPDTIGSVGWYPSLALDALDNPVVSYYDISNGDLKVLHCNDASCIGGNESIVIADATAAVANFNASGTSLVLNASGFPVVSYRHPSGKLRVIDCNDADCAGNDDTITEPDPTGGAGSYVDSAMVLDASGSPVVSYYLGAAPGLRVLHCDNPTCAASKVNTPAGLAVSVSPSTAVDITFDHVKTSGFTSAISSSPAAGAPSGFTFGSPSTHYEISTTATFNGMVEVCITYADSSFTPAVEAALRLMHYTGGTWVDVTTSLNITTNVICGESTSLSPFAIAELLIGQDYDGDGCPNEKELTANELFGGDRDPLNPYDYFNPSDDGVNRIDDILLVVNAYFKDDADGNPGLPPYFTGGSPVYTYSPDTDRTYVGPNAWNLGAPNGLQRVDDIVNAVHQYFHDCS